MRVVPQEHEGVAAPAPGDAQVAVQVGGVQVVLRLEVHLERPQLELLKEDLDALVRRGLDGGVDGLVDGREEGDGADLLLVARRALLQVDELVDGADRPEDRGARLAQDRLAGRVDQTPAGRDQGRGGGPGAVLVCMCLYMNVNPKSIHPSAL